MSTTVAVSPQWDAASVIEAKRPFTLCCMCISKRLEALLGFTKPELCDLS